MPKYRQITSHERYVISALKKQGLSVRSIARHLGRAPSSIAREIERNRSTDGAYRPSIAAQRTRGRRSRSRRNSRFGSEDWELVEHLIGLDWSPEQVSGWLRLHQMLSISYETIYLRVWADKHAGGELWKHMRQACKKRRKRRGSRDGRGRLPGKRHISERPPEVEDRSRTGDWEIDTIKGDSQGRHSAVTMVERRTGYLEIGKLEYHNATECSAKCVEIIGRQHLPVLTVTADNGTEFHSYKNTEAATGALFYFATPHHSWERGTNENTNGLIRQYLPKRTSMAHLGQSDFDAVARKLNTRPRKRLGFRTPEECYVQGR